MTEEQFAALTEPQAQLMVVQQAFAKFDSLLKSSAKAEVRALLAEEQYQSPKRLEPYGFKVFSQNEEDGIVQEIFRRIGVTNRTFFEFGCGNGLESNCAYLALQGWQGAWVDGNEEYLKVAREKFKTAGPLTIRQAFITAGNINDIAAGLKLPEELDLLSIDIDGNDLYVWEALTVLQPRVVVIEYNASFPPPADLVQKYQANGTWNGTNYFGASLRALMELGKKKGYVLVGTSLSGVNAFFVSTKWWSGDDFEFEKPDGPALDETLFNPPRFELGAHGFPTGHPPDIGPMR